MDNYWILFRNRVKNLVILELIALSLISYSAVGSDFHSPRTDALGGAGHAAPLLSDAIYLNPSFGSFNQVHSLSFNYLTYSGGTIQRPEGPIDYYGHNANISILDGTAEQLFQAGVGYTRRDDLNILHVGTSKSFVQNYGVGLGAKFIFPNDGTGNRITDATFSASGIFNDWIQSSLIIDNLWEAAPNLGFYREVILGTKINVMKIVLFYLDPHWSPTLGDSTFGYEAGVEFPFMSDLFLRAGTFKNSTIPYQAQRGDGYGLGFGWLAPKLSLDYAYSRAFIPIAGYSHNLGATIFF
ncbi:MAG: hypothetical protein ABIQ95_03055 [Bdellovibrionia bacterium]